MKNQDNPEQSIMHSSTEARETAFHKYRSIAESDLSPQHWASLQLFCKQTGIPISEFYFDGKNENGIIYNNALSLEGNESIAELPDNLTINGYLNISGCKKLSKLPKTLYVRGELIIGEPCDLPIDLLEDAAYLVALGRVEDGIRGRLPQDMWSRDRIRNAFDQRHSETI